MGYLSGTCVTWQEGSRLPRLPERETGRRTEDRIAIIRGEAIPSPGGEFREEREPVAADKGPAPFHRTAGGEAEPADQQRPGGRRSPEYALLRRGRHDPRICSRPPSTRRPARAASSSYSAAWVKSASRSLTETLGENGVLSNYRFELTKQSPLADPAVPAGYVAADKHTLIHPRWPNVFTLGDAANLPTSKTGAAARKQAPVLVANLTAAMRAQPGTARYNGYTSCPLVTSRNRMLLAKFDYDLKPKPSIPFINTMKPRYDMWLLKRYGLPALYWNLMLRGRA